MKRAGSAAEAAFLAAAVAYMRDVEKEIADVSLEWRLTQAWLVYRAELDKETTEAPRLRCLDADVIGRVEQHADAVAKPRGVADNAAAGEHVDDTSER